MENLVGIPAAKANDDESFSALEVNLGPISAIRSLSPSSLCMSVCFISPHSTAQPAHILTSRIYGITGR